MILLTKIYSFIILSSVKNIYNVTFYLIIRTTNNNNNKIDNNLSYFQFIHLSHMLLFLKEEEKKVDCVVWPLNFFSKKKNYEF